MTRSNIVNSKTCGKIWNANFVVILLRLTEPRSVTSPARLIRRCICRTLR